MYGSVDLNYTRKHRQTVTTKAICCISVCYFLQFFFLAHNACFASYSITALILLACFPPVSNSLWIC